MKSAFEYSPVKGTTAWALLYEGEEAGKLVVAWPGVTCAATLSVWRGPLAGPDMLDHEAAHGAAGGYGYDKLSAAVCDALQRRGVRLEGLGHGSGASSVRRAFENLGYVVIEVIS